MRVWLDTEFHERGPMFPIDLISIGMVREDGAELYLVNSDADYSAATANSWLYQNVLPYLPHRTFTGIVGQWSLDRSDPRVHPREAVAVQVGEFLAEATPNLELWAWYADYDHVALCQLFGRMIDLPDFMPMYTRDLKQEVDRLAQMHDMTIRLDEAALREQAGADNAHDALADARYSRQIALYLREQFGEWTCA